MRMIQSSKIAACFAASVFTVACADTVPTGPTGPTGQVEVAIGSLEYPGLTGATFALTIEDSLGATVYHNASVSSADYGSPDGRVLFIAPCSAGNGTTAGLGDAGTEENTVRVELLEIRADGQVLTKGSGDVYFSPALEQTIDCVESADTRVDFVFNIVRRAQQGFSDVVVQIQDIFCSYKVSCEQGLMADPEPPYAPGPTLVTGFACSDGDVAGIGANYVGFQGSLCCNGALPGDAGCTTLDIDPATGQPVWSDPGLGVLDTRSYMDDDATLGKVFHNTTWRLDASVVAAGCVFSGRGHFNWSDDGAVVDYAYDEGGDGVSAAPAFFFDTAIAGPNEAGELLCGSETSTVEVAFSATLP